MQESDFPIDYKKEVTKKIINYGLNFIALMAIPLNIIIYFALERSQLIIIRVTPILFSLVVFIILYFKNKISTHIKLWIFTILMFSAGLYTLLLGLLDMASLWFVVSIIFSMFIRTKNISLIIFIISFIFTVATGFLLFFKNQYLPIDYGFENCQFACIVIRIINFLIIGFLIFKILQIFFQTIDLYIKEIVDKNIVLEQLKATEKNEAEQMLNNQILKSEIEIQKRELEYKHKELTSSFSKIVQFNTLLDNIKKDITSKNFNEALVNITANQSKNYSFESFVIKFNKLYPHFITKLTENYPQLSETDINLCILIIAGLKSIEIAELLNVKETTVGTYRNRLRKKFGLKNNADLTTFLLEKIKSL